MILSDKEFPLVINNEFHVSVLRESQFTHLFLGSDALIIGFDEAAATGAGDDVTTDDGKRFAGLGGSGGGTSFGDDVTMAESVCECGGGGGGSGLCFVLTRFTTVA